MKGPVHIVGLGRLGGALRLAWGAAGMNLTEDLSTAAAVVLTVPDDAIAPVAGGPPSFGACKGAIAAWVTHGSGDEVVPLTEGTASRDKWVQVNGCATQTVATAPAPCIAYADCERDVHWCEHDGGHEWPGFAGEAIWSFFAAQ